MRKLYPLFMLIVFLLAACGDGDPQTQTDADDRAKLRVTVSEALVFDRPSRDSNVLFRLIEGDQLVILVQTPPDLIGVVWYQVAQGEQFGWIAGSQVQVSGDLSAVRVADAAIWEPTPLPITPTVTLTPTTFRLPEDVVGHVNVSQATVFDTPSRDAAAVANLFEGETVDILGRVRENAAGDAFYFVGKNGSALGWVLVPQLNIEGDLETVPLLEDTVLSISGIRLDETATAESIVASFTGVAQNTTPATEIAQATDSPSNEVVQATQTTVPLQTTPDLASTALAASTATLTNDSTPSPIPTNPQGIQVGVAPPLEIDLLDGWESVDILVPINTVYLQGSLPVSVYEGSLGNGIKGTMWIVWGFPNITSPTGGINLYGDGVQLLRSFVFDPETCNIGLGSQPGEEPRQYMIGEHEAIGTTYAAVDCDGSEDIAGFFAVLQVGGGNFAFFVGVEPVGATDLGLPQIQSMLDTVVFTDLNATEEPTP